MEEPLEAIVRESYGRLLAALVKRFNDIELAEDSLAEAFREALEKWPVTGIPNRPEAWLLTVARRRFIDEIRRAVRGRELLAEADWPVAEAEPQTRAFPDERLELILLCCHPALERSIQIPLALQSIFRISARRLATGFAITPQAMSARLVRAKRMIRDGKLWFDLTDSNPTSRMPALLESLYLAFTLEGDEMKKPDENLRPELLSLVELLCELTEPGAEMLGLRSLFGFLIARDRARVDAKGDWVALSEQDPARWDWALMKDSDQVLRLAHALGDPGRYQLEAAIESARAAGCRTGRPPWEAILKLYEALYSLNPRVGCAVAWAAALLSAGEPDQALAKLTNLSPDSVAHYQPYYAVMSSVLSALERDFEADAAALRARELSTTEGQLRFLESKRF